MPIPLNFPTPVWETVKQKAGPVDVITDSLENRFKYLTLYKGLI